MDISAGCSNLCRFCEESIGKYTCPRCNFNYCSVECYKSPRHSDCSESFYKECVEQELQVREPDPQTRQKMIDILKKQYDMGDEMSGSDENEDSDDETGLEERLKGVDLDDTEEVWSKLTAEEQKDFLELANAGDITKLVPIWEPWWTQTYDKPKVTFEGSAPPIDYKKLCPEVKSNIASLKALSKVDPSPLIFNNLINVICSYAIATRFLNGEHIKSPNESSHLLLELSKNLSHNVVFDTLDLAIESVSSQAINSQIVAATVENISVMKCDIANITMGPNKDDPSFYILAALSDISFLLSQVIRNTKPHCLSQVKKAALPVIFEKKIKINFSKKHFSMAHRKIDYYLSWVTACYSDIIDQFKLSFV